MKAAVKANVIYQAVTANRTSDGVPIYWTAEGGWSTRIADAAHPVDATTQLAEAQAGALKAIAPYVIPVMVVEGAIRPVGLREEIRAFGPTV